MEKSRIRINWPIRLASTLLLNQVLIEQEFTAIQSLPKLISEDHGWTVVVGVTRYNKFFLLKARSTLHHE